MKNTAELDAEIVHRYIWTTKGNVNNLADLRKALSSLSTGANSDEKLSKHRRSFKKIKWVINGINA